MALVAANKTRSAQISGTRGMLMEFLHRVAPSVAALGLSSVAFVLLWFSIPSGPSAEMPGADKGNGAALMAQLHAVRAMLVTAVGWILVSLPGGAGCDLPRSYASVLWTAFCVGYVVAFVCRCVAVGAYGPSYSDPDDL